MTTKFLAKACPALLLSFVLALSVGCGEGGESDSVGVDPAEVTRLEAMVQKGDADAALKLGELYAANGENHQARIQAAKWFHIAGRMGNSDAGMLLNTITAGMTAEDDMQIQQMVESYKIPTAE
jgi:thioredoxin-like negative regulator of GroEL